MEILGYVWRSVFSFCVIVIVMPAIVDSTTFDVGLCDNWIYKCQCGTPPKSYSFRLSFKQCSHFSLWGLKCEPCNNENPGERCVPYRQCQECRDDYPGCIACPPGKYGFWCDQDCKCQNKGLCNKHDGSCSCQPGFGGTYCEARIHCDPPEKIAALSWDGDLQNVGDAIEAKCKSGFTLVGAKRRTCAENGTWVPKAPLCEPVCPFPKLGIHLKATVNPRAVKKMRDSSNNELIKDIEFRCVPGFTLVGPHRLQCMSNGNWDQDPPKCQAIKVCPDPGIPARGNRTVIDDIDGAFVPGSIIKFNCNPGYFLNGPEITSCGWSGNWTAKVPQCLPIVGCPPPNIPENGKVEVTKPLPKISARPQSRIVSRIGRPLRKPAEIPTAMPLIPPGYSHQDAKALYSCKSVYYRLVGPSTRICQSKGEWSGQEPECKVICGKSYEAKRPSIVNGTTSLQGKWPWQVAIDRLDLTSSEWTFACGGTLLGESWVLTAAHCVSEQKIRHPLPVRHFKVYLGNHFKNISLNSQHTAVFSVKRFVIHPNFHPRSFDSDLALIELSRPASFSSRIQPVCLPHPLLYNNPTIILQDNLPFGLLGTVTGWGLLSHDGPTAEELQEVEIPIVNRTFCEEEFRRQNLKFTVTLNMFCAGFQSGGVGTCNGDSGGPFVLEESVSGVFPGKNWVQYGVVSWKGTKCAAANQYTGFVNLARYVSWIREYVT